MIKQINPPKHLYTKRKWQLFEVDIASTVTKKHKTAMFAKRPNTVMVVPFLEKEKKLLMVKEYCPTHNKEMLFFPKGKIDQGEPCQIAAQRELQEEVHKKAQNLAKMAVLQNDKMQTDTHVFLAENLENSPLNTGDEIEDSQTITVSVQEFKKLLSEGNISESRTVASFFLALEHLQSKKLLK